MGEEKQAEENATGGFMRVVISFWEPFRVFLIALVIVLPIRYFIVQPFIVRGASMEPNFENGDYLIIDEVSYYFRAPKRGETIVFRYPRNPRQFFIKRIVALPEERVEVVGGRIKVFNEEYPDGFTLDEPYLVPPNRTTRPNVSFALGPDEYYVLGDNRDFSSDSRVWGALEDDLIIGRALFRVWPFDEFGLVQNYAFNF